MSNVGKDKKQVGDHSLLIRIKNKMTTLGKGLKVPYKANCIPIL